MSNTLCTARDADRTRSGFTLVELLVVLAVMGLLLRTVVSNYRADIPLVSLRATATAIAAELDFLRTEARLQGGRYGMEIDLAKQAFRIILPPERRKPKEDEEALKSQKLMWSVFEKGVRLTGVNLGDKEEARNVGTIKVVFDERGRTQQKVLIFRHQDEAELIFSVIIPALGGNVEARVGDHGFPTATDLDF
jgi:prepilin-type N-terminal cleavage/methylation domain-containing protein